MKCYCGRYATIMSCMACNFPFNDCGCPDRIGLLECHLCYIKKIHTHSVCMTENLQINLIRLEDFLNEYKIHIKQDIKHLIQMHFNSANALYELELWLKET